MSTQDAVNLGNRKTTARRVKFGATLEDLEGRVLLSAVHHVQLHRAAHVRVLPVHTVKPASHAKPVSHARAVTPVRYDARSTFPPQERCQGDRHRHH